MTDTITIISDALLELGVINESETPSAEQGSHALRKLNQMLEEWEEAGIKLGWAEQSDTSGTAPLPPYAERGVTLKLTLALASSYGGAASVTPALVAEADDAYGRLLRKAMLGNVVERKTGNIAPSEVPGGVWDITRGY